MPFDKRCPQPPEENVLNLHRQTDTQTHRQTNMATLVLNRPSSPNANSHQRRNKTLSKKTFWQKDGLAHCLSYATLVTNVQVLVAVLFLFLSEMIFDGVLALDEQKPKLVSAHPPNKQTLNQKKTLFPTDFMFIVSNFSYVFNMMMTTPKKSVKHQSPKDTFFFIKFSLNIKLCGSRTKSGWTTFDYLKL